MRISHLQKSALVLFLSCLISLCGLKGQTNLNKHAEDLMVHQKYEDALDILNNLKEDNDSYFLKRGICNYYVNNLDQALADLGKAFEKGNESSDLIKHLAMAHHKKGEFYEAARAYKLYLNEIDRDDPERPSIIHAIKNCNYGRKAVYADRIGFVENLGTVVNSTADEIAPIKSPNFETKYYFSSDKRGSTGGLRNKNGLKDDIFGHYAADIYAVEMINGSWTPSTGVPPLLNSARNELIQGFSDNGRVLVFLKSGGGQKPEIVSDTFSLEVDAYPQLLVSPANGSLGDKDLFFVNDSTFLFSSMRKGGFGGYDIYITTKESGSWIEPVNLGPEINSPYDEETPFLSNSKNLLYFSSNRQESIGGYDIYFASYGIERGKWTRAENIGMPISSPGNDKYYRLSDDGRSAIFSSDRSESIGGYDLFVAYLKNQVYEQLSYVATVPFLRRSTEMAGISANEDPDTIVPAEVSEEPVIKEENTVKKRELVISPLFYNEDGKVLSGSNNKALKDILDMMIIFPTLKAVFTGHTQNEGSKAYDLYFSVKRAEQAADYLVQNGIDPERVLVYGVGSNYPMVKTQGTTLAVRNNNRIEVKLTDLTKDGLITSYSYPIVNDYLKDDRSETFRKKISALTYRVMITQVKQMYDNPLILAYPNVIVQKKNDRNGYAYSVGLLEDYFSALDIKNELIRSGFLDVKLKAFENGLELSPEEARARLTVYPDLKNYIDNELK
jgi:outer membrane protein OmpA-like peptidoglycan-associated protein